MVATIMTPIKITDAQLKPSAVVGVACGQKDQNYRIGLARRDWRVAMIRLTKDHMHQINAKEFMGMPHLPRLKLDLGIVSGK